MSQRVPTNELVHAAILVAAFALLPAANAQADTAVVVQSEGSPLSFSITDITIGWRFNVASPVQVTALGMFDSGSDGFESAHPVAIFDSHGASVVELSLVAGTVLPLLDEFRYAALKDEVILVPGELYTIAAFLPGFASSDAFISQNGVHTMHPLINQVGAGVLRVTSDFGMPEIASVSQFFGPNFRFTAVPGPGGLLTLLAGSGAIGRRRRQDA